MTRAVRFACLVSFAFGTSVFVGCGTATTLEDLDSGPTGTDTGTHVGNPDTGVITTGDGSIPQDTGMVTPFDSGLPPQNDAGGPPPRPDGGFMRPDTGLGGGNDAGTTMGIMCGTAVCGASEICCITRGAGGMMISQMCTAAGACMGAALACDGPEDCMTGQACCGSFTGGTAGSMCVASAMCQRGRFCHVDTDCTGTDMCCNFMGVNVCSPRCF